MLPPASPPTNSTSIPLIEAQNNTNKEENPLQLLPQYVNNNNDGAATSTTVICPQSTNSTIDDDNIDIVATPEFLQTAMEDLSKQMGDIKLYIADATAATGYDPSEKEIIKQMQIINSWGVKNQIPPKLVVQRLKLAKQGIRFFDGPRKYLS